MPSKNKTFGNWLDNKVAPSPPKNLLSSEAEKKKYRREKQVYELKVILALCDHYNISAEEGEGMWPALALNLARDFVPAMQTPKLPGSKKDWGWIELACLDVLVARAEKERNPDFPYASVFNQTLIEKAKNTRLKEIVEKNSVTEKTLQNKHLEYRKSPDKALFDKMFGLIETTEEEKEQLKDDLLQDRI